MKSSKKILHVIPNLGYGGVEKIVLNYYERLDKNKYCFDFVTHGPVMEYHRDLVNQGSKIYYFKSIGQIGIRKYKKQIKNHIPLEEYDFIHIHVGHLTGVYAKIFKDLKAEKVICHAHTTMCVKRWHAFCMPLLRFLSIHYADVLVACGEDAGKFCFGKGNFVILPNALSYDEIEKVGNDLVKKLKEELSIPQDVTIIGHVGRFDHQKNHVFITKIIHDYVSIKKNVKFVLVGDGPEKGYIQDIIKANGDSDYVIFTGNRKDVATFMKMFDIFILPSLYEGLPVVGIEAQAAGTWCIFSDTIDKTVAICEENCSFLPIDKETDDWIREINRMTEYGDVLNTNIYKSLCESGYEISISVNKLIEIYDSVFNSLTVLCQENKKK